MSSNLLNIAPKAFLVLLLVVTCTAVSFADTIILKNGTLLVGKIKVKNNKTIVFKNYYGDFQISREQIKELFETDSYVDDIKIRKRLGIDFDEGDIRKNYEAGLKKSTIKEKKETKLNDQSWRGGKILLSGNYYYVLGDLNEPIPFGFGAMLACDQGLDRLAGYKRHFWMPGIRIEGGYFYFSRSDNTLSGITVSAGPLWQYGLGKGYWGTIGFSIQPGMSFLSIKEPGESVKSNTFTLHSTLGYEYPLGRISLFFMTRYMYIYDRDVVFNSIGVSAGVAVTVW